MQDIFNLLLGHGCVDLSPQININRITTFPIDGGGFGDVRRGELHDGTIVAIKTWRESLIEWCDYTILKRVTREIYNWSKMKHDNVHRLMGVFIFKEQSIGMVSEWMGNGNLEEYLRKNPNADRYYLSVQAASGLAYIHSQNVIHGDIKAINILVSLDRIVKLTDFGLSIMSESSVVFSVTTLQATTIRWAVCIEFHTHHYSTHLINNISGSRVAVRRIIQK
ncbi:kinase-like domain-containing protein [Rhizoctonia solani]|nr:kinase-like domain-containing protein [Rhizoctonia solani]